MARRTDHSREELYENALAAAQNIVETDGFRALTARNVADAIGYSPGTLYNLFANLDDLILHLNGRTLDALHDRLDGGAIAETTEARLAQLLDGYLGFLADHPRLWNVLFEYSLPEGQTPPEWYARKVERVLGLLEDALTPLFDDEEIDIRADAARTLWAGLHGICSLSGSGKLQVVSSQSMRTMAEGLVANYIAGLRVNRGGR
ncbi:MAG: TetR/AcrR family transcriptional regulator [Rhodospirillaceae bacterium]|nr:TetR/AcrR family transcriptional regulator [Rhodospirillaceae bacterium]